ncbi:MAG: NusG domain II-containing protein [Ruminococcaceae bacterium]|nr:NusG domain II-containing protein [Oscillospiraceae bacterium]
MKMIKLYDIVIIIIALICGASLMILPMVLDNDSNGVCVIKVNGEEIRRIDLSSVLEDETIVIDNEYGENHILVTKNGVSVIYSDCLQKVEMTDEPIYKPGQSLVCLPHRLVIEIIGEGDIPDAVTY